MTDDLQELADALAKAEEEYRRASKMFSDASINLRVLKKKHLEQSAKAAGWEPGILVVGKLKPLERLPRKLWSAQQTRRQRVNGIYMGARDGADFSEEPVLDIRRIGSKGQPLKDTITHTELFDWHRVIESPKSD